MKYYIEDLFTNKTLVLIATTDGEDPTNLIKQILSRTDDYIHATKIFKTKYNVSVEVDYKENINIQKD